MRKESKVDEGHLTPDQVHMMISIRAKYAASQLAGYIKAKSAIHLAQVYGERKRNFVGQHFWAREYFRRQEAEDARFDQLNMWR